jgi:hypothetical protein
VPRVPFILERGGSNSQKGPIVKRPSCMRARGIPPVLDRGVFQPREARVVCVCMCMCVVCTYLLVGR